MQRFQTAITVLLYLVHKLCDIPFHYDFKIYQKGTDEQSAPFLFIGINLDYGIIYTVLIERGRHRQRAKGDGLHRHRVVPGYKGGTYNANNLSFLTRKEHRLVHLLRYRLFGEHQDILAFMKLSGKTRGRNYAKFTQTPEWIAKRINKTANKGMVTCIDTQGNSLRVTKTEFDSRNDLRGVNTGGYKLKPGANKGNNNPQFGKKRKDLSTRNKLSKGTSWYNNGFQSKRFFESDVTAEWQRGRI